MSKITCSLILVGALFSSSFAYSNEACIMTGRVDSVMKSPDVLPAIKGAIQQVLSLGSRMMMLQANPKTTQTESNAFSRELVVSANDFIDFAAVIMGRIKNPTPENPNVIGLTIAMEGLPFPFQVLVKLIETRAQLMTPQEVKKALPIGFTKSHAERFEPSAFSDALGQIGFLKKGEMGEPATPEQFSSHVGFIASKNKSKDAAVEKIEIGFVPRRDFGAGEKQGFIGFNRPREVDSPFAMQIKFNFESGLLEFVRVVIGEANSLMSLH